MNLTPEQKKKILPVTTDQHRMKELISELTRDKEKIKKDDKVYYDEKKDKKVIEQYYSKIDFDNEDENKFMQSLGMLLKETHTNPLSYDPSEYVYPWVDLRPDGDLISIYSGKQRRPEDVMREDHETSLRRQQEVKNITETDDDQMKSELHRMEKEFKYNCEHAVPQSWFNEQEPMRGDLHHLFTCEPVCNSIRSNYPYYDFTNYNPGNISVERIEESCGKAEEELFEPEFAKGTVARAMLYFLLRYPSQIEQKYQKRIDSELLLDWHQKFQPSLYEKHRNQAIYQLQGNRNPYIDFPDMFV
ncbi:endonuclease I family protein [Halobacillus naozhouensis]|uniref:Endonuclease n=1 Tax=Halobacillus naozhouensis TaxID=554880 RepID=A0ABY8IUQ3_9BACI|nr:endonuclease [Halobacillus naozhouensis]WFT72994.1 endonuclease [Halobacillus naozhouensis]